jgi:hypothetical protein
MKSKELTMADSAGSEVGYEFETLAGPDSAGAERQKSGWVRSEEKTARTRSGTLDISKTGDTTSGHLFHQVKGPTHL